nr:glycosyltransferase family 2 protein [uncultured Arsenicibacter sp.]
MKISVITINLNNKDGLKKTIESVVSQDYENFEYILVDGYSTDGSIDVIDCYSNRINKILSEKDSGMYEAMNKGWKMASGDYCLFLNSGDCLNNEKILSEVSKFLKPEYDIVYGDVINCYGERKEKFIFPAYIGIYELMTYSTYPHQATFIKRDLLVSLGGYDERYKVVSDWLFFLKATIELNPKVLKVELFVCYFDMNGISNTSNWSNETIQALSENYPFLIETKKHLIDLRKYKLSRAHSSLSWLIEKIKN